MYQLYYQPEGIWVGDIMPYGKEGQFYVYHQRDTRNPGPFGEPFGWALATTKDFVDYKDYGESLKRGTDEEADQFIYAGSVFETEAGFHAFYTGYNREFLKAGKTSQTLLHATSKDGITWVPMSSMPAPASALLEGSTSPYRVCTTASAAGTSETNTS